MITPSFFAEAIKRLKAYYPEFNLNKEYIQIWFEFFDENGIDDAELNFIFKTFSKQNSNPPRSPAHILNVYKDAIKETVNAGYPSPEEAWKLVRSAIQRYSPAYDITKYINHIKKGNPIAGRLVDQAYWREFMFADSSKTIDFIESRFKKDYADVVKREAEAKLKSFTATDRVDLLTNNEPLTLESGA